MGGGHPLPIPLLARRLRRLEAPSTQNPGYIRQWLQHGSTMPWTVLTVLVSMCLCVATAGVALGMQSQAIVDCQLSASESPVAGRQAKDARLGGPSGRHTLLILPVL